MKNKQVKIIGHDVAFSENGAKDKSIECIFEDLGQVDLGPFKIIQPKTKSEFVFLNKDKWKN